MAPNKHKNEITIMVMIDFENDFSRMLLIICFWLPDNKLLLVLHLETNITIYSEHQLGFQGIYFYFAEMKMMNFYFRHVSEL